MWKLEMALYFVFLILPMVSGSGIRSVSFASSVFDSAPLVLSNQSSTTGLLGCAMSCNELNASLCTGFQVTSGRCILYKGNVLEKSKSGPYTSDDVVYKVSQHPRCEDYEDFHLMVTSNETYCLYFDKGGGYHSSAVERCHKRGAHLTFLDTWSKFNIVGQGFSTYAPGATDTWVGALSNGSLAAFWGEYHDNVLLDSNDLWIDDEPNYSSELCVMAELGRGLNNVNCGPSRYSKYTCEILDFYEKP